MTPILFMSKGWSCTGQDADLNSKWADMRCSRNFFFTIQFRDQISLYCFCPLNTELGHVAALLSLEVAAFTANT